MPPKRKAKADPVTVAAAAPAPVPAPVPAPAQASAAKRGKPSKKTSVMATTAAQAASVHAIDPAAVPLIGGYATSPTVYVDPITAEVLDLLLVQVELSTNTDKYYVLQLIYDTVIPSNFFVFTRWGRTGTKGQSAIEGPSTFIDASALFESKFLDKTGCEWHNRANFVSMPKKYNFMKINHNLKVLNSAPGAIPAKWEYYINDNVDGKPNGWYEYTAQGAEDTEDLWTVYQSNSSYSQRIVASGLYNYLVDLINMTQTNVSVANGKTRMIRRSSNGIVTCSASAPTSPVAVKSFASNSPQLKTTVLSQTTSQSVFANTAAFNTSIGLSFSSSPAPSKVKASNSPSKAKSVDADCTLGAFGVSVVEDYDAMLNQVDLAKNTNKFYRLQLLTKNNSFYLWTKWGRVGDPYIPSQSGLIGPSSKEQAIKDFGKKFKSKSGNDWGNKASFVPKKGCYELIARADDDEEDDNSDNDNYSVSVMSSPGAKSSGLPILPSTLPMETQHLISFIFNLDMFKSAMQDLNIDLKRMPLGKLSSKQIDKGFDVLQKIKTIINSKGSHVDMQSLSSDFYQVIPHSFKRNVRPPVINSIELLDEKYEMLNTLSDISTAQGLMSGGQSNNGMNPIDRHYMELKADLELLCPGSNATHAEYYQAIQTYISCTRGYHGITLDQVWEVRRHPEDATFATFNAIDNHCLLWHGTNVAVVAAILKTGLRIMPAVNGGRVGRGIYMANELSKSASYVRTGCNASGTRIGILFLVQAALGDMHVIYRDDGSLVSAPPGFNSVLAKGQKSPYGGATTTLMLDGKPVAVPQAAPVLSKVKEEQSSSFSQDEFLVYNEHQQRLRFVLTFRY